MTERPAPPPEWQTRLTVTVVMETAEKTAGSTAITRVISTQPATLAAAAAASAVRLVLDNWTDKRTTPG